MLIVLVIILKASHFVKYLREELKFNSVQELVERMGIDEQETRKYFEGKDLREVLNVL